MDTNIKTLLRIVIVLLIILILLSIYSIFFGHKTRYDENNPTFCQYDDDCTTYSVPSCINAKPINKEYKNRVLELIEPNDSLCGEIKTACKNQECVIVK